MLLLHMLRATISHYTQHNDAKNYFLLENIPFSIKCLNIISQKVHLITVLSSYTIIIIQKLLLNREQRTLINAYKKPFLLLQFQTHQQWGSLIKKKDAQTTLKDMIIFGLCRTWSGNLCAVSIFDLLVGFRQGMWPNSTISISHWPPLVHFKIQKKTIIHQSMKR